MDNIDYIMLDDYEIVIEHDGKLEKEDLEDVELSFIHLLSFYILGSPIHRHITKLNITKTGETADIPFDKNKCNKAFWEKYRLWLKKI